jgi:hypothetical protein
MIIYLKGPFLSIAFQAKHSAHFLLTEMLFSSRFPSALQGGVAQLAEHAAHIRSVRGSTPCTATILTHN